MEISTGYLVCFTPAVQVGWNQLKPDQSSLVQSSAHDLKGNIMAYCITSTLNFNKGGCVRQI